MLIHLTAQTMITASFSSILAYVGPGLGLSALAALWAVIVAIFTALGAVLYWPIRALLRKRREKKQRHEKWKKAAGYASVKDDVPVERSSQK